MYTVGADPEFLVEDVPKKYVQQIGQTMNFLVDRVKSGHPVQHGHTINANGVFFVAVQLQGEELCEALASKCRACDHSAVVQFQPSLPPCDQCICPGDAGGNGYIAFGGEGHRLTS